MLILAAALCLLPPPPPGDPVDASNTPPTGMEWFRQADENRDGFLTFDEFPNRRMFLAFDADADNRLSMEELARAIADRAPERPNERDLPGVEIRRNVRYLKPDDSDAANDVPPSDPRLTSLDLYLPTTILAKGERRPIIAFVHGGGWRIGDKTRVQSKPKNYCQNGYVFASINYRLSPDVVHPTHAQDVAAAVAWLHDNAERFGGDPSRIVLMGHSSGAHLVSLVATDPSYLGEHGLSPADLRGIVSLDSASYDLSERADDVGMRKIIKEAFGEDPDTLQAASPLHHVTSPSKYPPFLIVYASRRPIAERESERFADAIKQAGGDAQIVQGEDKDHAAVNTDTGVRGDAMSEAIDRFIRRVMTANEGSVGPDL